MHYEFSLNSHKAMINFTARYCETHEQLLESKGFKRVLLAYIKSLKKRSSNVYINVKDGIGEIDDDKLSDYVIYIVKLLLIMDRKAILKFNDDYSFILNNDNLLVHFIDGLYSFWRRLERYTIVYNNSTNQGLENMSFIDANTKFSKLIKDTYRKIKENIEGQKPKVYRQLPAGGNVGLILNNYSWNIPEEYECLAAIPFIDTVSIETPFIIYPKRNTRDGIFSETFQNPLSNCEINNENWFCFPAKVGKLLAFIYFHKDFISHGISLCNLFELARKEEYINKTPDIVYVFGVKEDNNSLRTIFYDDIKNGIMVGYINYSEEIDYFGYMKKMTLTLHNLIVIKHGCIPIHGAMVNILTKDNKSANIIIMGDSGAGKSESLEAFRELGEDYISDMTIIFDDMGFVKLNGENMPLGYGTEIGAFVRLDDLEPGYAFKEIDRSIFMNPDKINARLVMPVTSYNDVIKGYPIDIFVYANNYEDGNKLEFFKSAEEALPTFRSGSRFAKGTTTEEGLVTSYFANPFGPVQRKVETDKLLIKYMDEFFKLGVKVGQIRTCLGIPGKEKSGPKEAAKELLEIVKHL